MDNAINDLAVVFKGFLSKEDYTLLCHIDQTGDDTSSDQIRKLLFDLALLEYNKFWRKSHPAVRLLQAYKECFENSKDK